MVDRNDSPLAEHLPQQDREVRLLLESGRVLEANALFDEVVSGMPPGEDDRWRRATVLVHRAVVAFRLSRIPLALELAAEAWVELDAERPEGTAAAQTIGMLGYLVESIGHRRAALDMMRVSVELARRAGHPETLAHCMQRLGGTLNMRAAEASPDDAKRIFSEAQGMLEEALSLVHTGFLHRALLAAYSRSLAGLGELAEAEELAQRALRLNEIAEDRWGLAVANWVLSGVRRTQGALPAARTLASRAVAEADRVGDTIMLRRFSHDLADICADLGDHVGEAEALRRGMAAGGKILDTLQEALGQALEQRRLAVQAQRVAVAAQEAAARDPLTGLVNRLGLERTAPHLIKRTASRGRVPWLVLVDVDWFKDVNDDAGHAAGDAALREIAQLLRRECRADDLVARWAGDEFVILLVDVSDERTEAGPTVAERIRAAVHGHDWRLVLGKTTRPPTVSIGVAAGPAQLDQLFTAADNALYRAKRQGRNRVEVQPPAEDELNARAASTLTTR
ncbi:diguanylate cyclase (GGDEF)-like protein [Actinoalloteichus hoggarensis]|uniref:Putative diguanylate cyclase YcdT n=1 Tax=Actinoalloteichus hoggarensis TaxID=1470176 RepID=A0A221VXI9_9PSEU|nr:diguanylate cyclase [Actinoalloteichus hoggarensis]ASO18269.1 putative diguanylate cyclase YcdT [Actinoalloteichus hoggarensis]MBB5921629.1 diguanylate cyclase (GGDEF)-like protein [Actinoalloteichus hoggarensis]